MYKSTRNQLLFNNNNFLHLAGILFVLLLLSACHFDIKTSTQYLISGNEYFQAGDYANAEKDYRIALKRDPKSVIAKNNIGVVLCEEGRYDEAAGFLNQALLADPKNATAHYTLAKALAKKGLYDQALKEAQQATQLDPDEPVAYKVLAEAALAKDEKAVAIDAYQSAIKLDPDNEEYKAALSKLVDQTQNQPGKNP